MTIFKVQLKVLIANHLKQENGLNELRSQQAETNKLVSALYGQGLTQSKVSEIFESLYGRHYSSTQIGRMIECMRADVAEWNGRPLEARYPVVFIDALWVNVRHDSVKKEVFYVVLGVKEDRTREVLAISHQSEENAPGWRMLLEELRGRGVSSMGEHVLRKGQSHLSELKRLLRIS